MMLQVPRAGPPCSRRTRTCTGWLRRTSQLSSEHRASSTRGGGSFKRQSTTCGASSTLSCAGSERHVLAKPAQLPGAGASLYHRVYRAQPAAMASRWLGGRLDNEHRELIVRHRGDHRDDPKTAAGALRYHVAWAEIRTHERDRTETLCALAVDEGEAEHGLGRYRRNRVGDAAEKSLNSRYAVVKGCSEHEREPERNRR